MALGARPAGLRWFALIASLIAVGLLLVIPSYDGMVSTSATGGGEGVVRRQRATLLAVNGVDALIPLSIPVLAAVNALVPWPVKYRRLSDVIGAIACAGLTILGSMTIGLYFVPTTILLAIIAAWPHPTRAQNV